MAGIKKLIADRRAKRGSFKRQCYTAKAKLDDVWRRPRGGQSKQRRHKKAKGAHPTPGFAGPAAVRGYHPCGMKETLVMTVAALESLDPATTAIRIGGTVGMKKRLEIQEKAVIGGFKVLNPKVIPEDEPADSPEEDLDEETREDEDLDEEDDDSSSDEADDDEVKDDE
ncbi:MAG: 50S ribosomal protein L32e [Methanocalculus sp. MSAO_Arc1]|uniref:50S ribosomal protein L32e n=1 Tax=Methanocalculus TaxID=71151 RepID=UPI000FF48F5E|nr:MULTISPECIES: 50S ribosomal protein L32e [unclassified Methanocalculus]MCP1662995.1 large subunit ribosomal protein L32e [Methanocalculus sp. AMF5]RQD80634.1 MAG: 50S ribosomal protein L32e [Methanocalculus sp. MSAO_Arc1]